MIWSFNQYLGFLSQCITMLERILNKYPLVFKKKVILKDNLRAIQDFKIKIMEYHILKTFGFSELLIRIQHQRQKAIPELV